MVALDFPCGWTAGLQTTTLKREFFWGEIGMLKPSSYPPLDFPFDPGFWADDGKGLKGGLHPRGKAPRWFCQEKEQKFAMKGVTMSMGLLTFCCLGESV